MIVPRVLIVGGAAAAVPAIDATTASGCVPVLPAGTFIIVGSVLAGAAARVL
jgi:hypothetical protein